MVQDASFAVIKFAAHPVRDERLNVGLIVFHQNSVDVRLSKRLDRIRALSSALNVDQVRRSLANLEEIDAMARSAGAVTVAERLAKLASFTPAQFSQLGLIASPSSFEYEKAIASLLQNLVDPEPAPVRAMKGRPSKLLTMLKRALREARVLARKGEDLNSHRIISKHPIADGYEADLILKNGFMHVFEVADATNEDQTPRKIISDIAVSALVFEQARMIYGQHETKTNLIYQASARMEAIATSALQIAEHQGAELINWESADDRMAFISQVSALATPLPQKKRGSEVKSINASTQHKFQLN